MQVKLKKQTLRQIKVKNHFIMNCNKKNFFLNEIKNNSLTITDEINVHDLNQAH